MELPNKTNKEIDTQTQYSKHMCSYLSEEDINFFMKHGYLHLKSIIPKEECSRYDRDVIQPALKRHAMLHENDPSTWDINHNPKLKQFSTQEVHENSNGIPIGIMVRDTDNPHDHDPIPSDENNWSSFFDNRRLNGILDELHNNNHIDKRTNSTSRQRRWQYIHPSSVGWIHVRPPILTRNEILENKSSTKHTKYNKNYDIEKKFSTKNTKHNKNYDINNETFYIPKGSWHVDGGHFTPHRISSFEQSVILLPMIRNVESNGGGNTILLSGSHVHIAKKLFNEQSNGIDKDILNEYCEEVAGRWPKDKIVEAAPSDAGDVWLLHPFIIHSAGRNTRVIEHKQENDSKDHDDVNYFRLTFNIGTQWNPSYDEDGKNDDLRIQHMERKSMSIMELSIYNAIHN